MEWTEVFFPIALGFGLTIAVMPLFIGYLTMKKHGQTIREEGPNWHQVKSGTPTMGGTVFLGAIFISTLITAFWQHAFSPTLIVLLIVMLLYGLLGFLDDFIKVFKKRNLGLNAKQKLLGQIVGALIFYMVYHYEQLPKVIVLPGNITWHLGGWFIVFVILWLVGFSNAVNLTDGIDGLVSGLGVISFGTYAIIAWKQQQIGILLLCLTTVGALIGFFVYNKKPAKIFMGDVGSLALGGLLAAISIALEQEWTLLLIGFVYIIETLSVMLQVTSYKLWKKRIFKMSPIHHHFEMIGWSEWKIDTVFWIVNLVTSALTLWILYK